MPPERFDFSGGFTEIEDLLKKYESLVELNRTMQLVITASTVPERSISHVNPEKCALLTLDFFVETARNAFKNKTSLVACELQIRAEVTK